jgi:hypothetical protein
MPYPLRVTFHAAAVAPQAEPADFVVQSVGGTIVVRGGLTAVGGSWTLSAVALRRRQTIVLHVKAREQRRGAAPELRDYRYAALVHEVPPGQYSLTVSHVYAMADPAPEGLAVTTFGTLLDVM